MKIFQITNVKAFTLLETLASLTILTVTIIGPLSVIVSSSSYARQTKDTVVATYLAEEPIELFQNQFDSLYIFCSKNPEDSNCISATGETSSQIAWRVFKERFSNKGNTASPSCYEDQKPSAQNVPGCSFDYTALNNNPTTTPEIYGAEDKDSCPYLMEDIQEVSVPNNAPYVQGGSYSSTVTEKRKTYKCKNASLAANNSKVYHRVITIKQLPTFETVTPGGPALGQYNDDLLITSKVNFKAYNGVTKTVEVIRFMHARS